MIQVMGDNEETIHTQIEDKSGNFLGFTTMRYN